MEKKTLIDPASMVDMMESSPVVVIDTRAPEEYAAGHIPGAVNIREIFSYLATSTPDGLETMHQTFADLLGAAGLSGPEHAVIYEDAMNNGYGQSCRGYFLLNYLGYPNVSILHGGLKSWTDAGLPLTTDVSTPEKKTFALAVDSSLMVTTPEMLESLSDPSIVKLDVRDWDEWVGESSSPYGKDFTPRKGRIPDAVLIEWYTLMDRSGAAPMFKSKDEIKDIAAKVGIDEDSTVNIYCFKGARASNTFVALNEAGIKNVKIYFASWNEWSRDMSLPIEEGAPDPARPAVRF
ncbi:MAG: sulfurtransferase [Janthinobacterium lividum]